jgi:D-alanine-D-alanine ligase-like ATP-grasp enzyme
MLVHSKIAVALLRLAYRLETYWNQVAGTEVSLEMGQFIPLYRRLWEGAAHAMRAEFSDIADGLWRVRLGPESTLISNYVVQVDDPVILKVAGHKTLCHHLLIKEGLPVPDHDTYRINEIHKAREFMKRWPGGCFVIKPAVGTAGGRGITLYVKSSWELWKASVRASLFSDQILIERFIVGQCYRLLFLNGEMIHAVRQRALWVNGDGQATIGLLFKRAYGLEDASFHTFSSDDPDYRATIEAQGLTDDYVPEPGERFLVRSALNCGGKRTGARTIYDEIATDLICNELQKEAQRAVETLGSRFASVELVTKDPTISLKESGGVIIEINTTPGLHRHQVKNRDDANTLALQVLSFVLKTVSNKATGSCKWFAPKTDERSSRYEKRE